MPLPKTILQGVRLAVLEARDAGKFLGSKYRNHIIRVVNAIANLRVLIQKPDGTTAEADVKMTEMGTVVTFPKEAFAAPTSGGSGATVGQYVIKSLAQDYFGCVTWDGTTEGTETVYVAKPYDLRGSLASEYLDPTTIATTYLYSYSYTAGQSYLRRTASVTISGTTTTEKQDIVPRYKIGSKILAASVESSGILGPDSVEITLIDLNISARAWCRAYTQ